MKSRVRLSPAALFAKISAPAASFSELENSGIRVAVGECRVTECWWWCPPYQTVLQRKAHLTAELHKPGP